ncbi:hypothetical protein [Hymenobacter jejuensis]|uniref:Uncharacterized protein n=1 Tax=Hymenobacter jejuensis TaxID=2502781 RepID=A0A5B8A5A0_9BACT|nr:hypothetical protein [Hymenobacter jejuensis]QDA61833.1 hypothetical protein FHG12_17785 [Hymenobacter jejuensis]
MEKLQTLLFILLGLIAFVWRMVKKAQETAAQESRQRPPRPAGQVPPLPSTSFQELLKQMQAQNQASQPVAPHVPAHTPGGRTVAHGTAPAARSLERTDVRPKSLEAPATNKSLEPTTPTMRRASSLPRAGSTPDPQRAAQQLARREERARQDSRPNVRDLLRNPTDLRTAFILSEVLKPKFD